MTRQQSRWSRGFRWKARELKRSIYKYAVAVMKTLVNRLITHVTNTQMNAHIHAHMYALVRVGDASRIEQSNSGFVKCVPDLDRFNITHKAHRDALLECVWRWKRRRRRKKLLLVIPSASCALEKEHKDHES